MFLEKLFSKLFSDKKEDDFKHLEELHSHPRHEKVHLEKPTKEIVNEINAPAKKSLFDLQAELNSLKKKIFLMDAKVSRTKNQFLLKEYSKELKDLKKKKILVETSMDARRRK